MKHHTNAKHPTAIPNWLSPEEGRKRLADLIEDFVGKAASADAEPEALALRVTAGADKTRSTLTAIARHADDLLARGHVLIYMPTLDLAERACNEFRVISPDVPCAVVRGRDAPRADSPGQKMCQRTDLVKKISGLVPSITTAICRKTTLDGVMIEAKCAEGCPYLAQIDAYGAKVYFLAHNYLHMNPPIDPETPVALRVIDEKFWPAQVKTTSILVEKFVAAPREEFDLALRASLSRVKGAILDGLQRCRPLHDHLRDEGVGVDLLSSLAQAEKNCRQSLDLYPNAQDATIALKLDEVDRGTFLSSVARQSLFARLIKRRDSHCNRITLGRLLVDGGPRDAIQHHQIKSVPLDAPLLMLDADADARIIEALVPGAGFETIDIKPEADVVQVSDRTLSNAWLLEPKKGSARRKDVLRVIAREVATAEGRDVLVVATTSVLAGLQQDCGQSGEGEDLRQTILGATPRWFGPGMQGLNDYEDYSTIVVVGRLQPPLIEVDAQARSIFGDYLFPIDPLPAGSLPAAQADVLMADDQLVQATSRIHPDGRVQAMLEQTRERGTLQSIARLRLVAPTSPKRVVILSSLPLPDFPISTLAPFFSVVSGLEKEPDPAGYLRLDEALTTREGRPVRGVRLSAAGLASDLPHGFTSLFAAEGFRRDRRTPAVEGLIRRVVAARGWPVTFLDLRERGAGGNPVRAAVFCEHVFARDIAMLLWPKLEPLKPSP